MSTTLTRIRAIVGDHLGEPADSIHAEADLRNDLRCDSLDIVEIVIAVEEDFGIEVSDEMWQALRSVADVVAAADAMLLAREA